MTTEQGIQPTPPPDGGTILLPPAPQPSAAPATASAGRHAWDRLLALLVVVLAFLTASFLARNSDLWFHLATGRLLAQGQFSFGTDPFAYTTQNNYWACHSWLFDLGLYGLYGLAGGAELVVAKALVVAALAGLLLRVRRPGSGALLPAIGTTLAVLAMSARLFVQPACLSYFLLGVTFWLLWSGHRRTGKTSLLPYILLPPLFALWVNVDEWFLLGPLLTALFWLGERLRGQRQAPGWVLPAGLAACLLSPHTYHALVLPSDLSPVTWTSGLRDDARFQALFTSPWSPTYLAAAGSHPATLAYFALAGLGLASFLLHRPALRDWRLVVWLPFAALAAWQLRAVPFFAVVAAPITVLNWQDYIAEYEAEWSRNPWAAWGPPAGRLLLTAALLALIGLTWIGWVAGTGGREGRHVAWGVRPDPSLRRAAEALHGWRRQGLLPDGGRVFAVSPEAAQYGAWFAPGERFFFDHRYQLFPTAAGDYEEVCRALLTGESSGDEWRRVLRENGVGVVVFSDREPRRLFAVLSRVAAGPADWTLLDVAGQALLIGWNGSRPAGAPAPPAFDADRLAFGPQDDVARLALPAAPEKGPEYLAPRRDLRARLTEVPAPTAWESAAATMFLHYADDSAAAQDRQQQRTALGGYAASLAALPASPSGAGQVMVQLVSSADYLLSLRDAAPRFLVREQLGPFFAVLVERQPALPLLAVRAARRAVAVNPEDANAWLRLGQAYLLLRNATWEHSGTGLLPPLAQLRHVQIATALEQAVRLNPDLEVAHRELAYLYGERNRYLDQALEHRREELRLSRRAGPLPGESPDEAADRLELLEKDTAKLVELVEDRRKTYASASRAVQGDRLKQADLALRLGLVRLALDDVLLKTPVDLLGAAGIRLELDLLLCLGRAEDVRDILTDEGLRASKQGLLYYDLLPPKGAGGGPLYAIPYHWPAYEWLHTLQAAGVGDYAVARDEAAAIRAGLKAGHDQLARRQPEFDEGVRQLLPGLLSGPQPFVPAFAAQTLVGYLEKRAALQVGEPVLRAQQADLDVIEGMLALEQGDTVAARSVFAEAEALCERPATPFAGATIAARYLGKLNARH